MAFKDHFSSVADEYSSFRPTYPAELVDFLAGIAPRRDLVWEVGCGSGQLTTRLASRFDRVVATDASEMQIANAPRLPNVEYRCAFAEQSPVDSHTADLCVAAQAAHWFDLEAYYAEVRRVGGADSILALVTYGLLQVDDRVDALVRRFYSNVLTSYWPPERKYVEDGYRSLSFPFDELQAPAFEMRTEWTLMEVAGYVSTWSGVRALVEDEGTDAIDAFLMDLSDVWDSQEEKRSVRWPISLRIGRVGRRESDRIG